MINTYVINRYISATAGRAKLRVVYENHTQPRTDGKVIYLPKPNPVKMTENDVDDMRHYVAHEVSHVLFSDFRPIKTINMQSLFGAVVNVIEDHRVDTINGLLYEGDRLDTDSYMRRVVKKLATKITGKDQAEKHLAALLLWDLEVRRDIFPTCSGEAHLFERAADKKFLATLRKHSDELIALRTEADPFLGTKATVALARKLLPETKDDEDSPEEKAGKKKKSAEKAGDGKEEATPASGTEKGDEKAEAESEDTDEIISVKYKDLVPHSMDEKGSSSPSHIDYTGHDYRTDFVPAPLKDIRVYDMRDESVRMTMTKDRPGWYSYSTVSIDRTSAEFSQQVRLRLQTRAAVRYEYGLKQGRLHSGAVYRCTLKNAPGINERLFKKRKQADTLDTAVSILVDTSSSMSRSKYKNAMIATMLLNEVVGNVLHIPLEIVGFTDDRHGTMMFVHRSFSDTLVSAEDLKEGLNVASRAMNGNADGEAIHWTYDRLVQRREKRKVLVVLSDGGPACSRPGDIYYYTRRMIKDIEAEKRVELYGLGIEDDNVRDLYKEHSVINDSSELERELLTLIDRKLT